MEAVILTKLAEFGLAGLIIGGFMSMSWKVFKTLIEHNRRSTEQYIKSNEQQTVQVTKVMDEMIGAIRENSNATRSHSTFIQKLEKSVTSLEDTIKGINEAEAYTSRKDQDEYRDIRA